MVVTVVLVMEAPEQTDHEPVIGLYGLAECIGDGTVNLISAVASNGKTVVDIETDIFEEIRKRK